MKLNPIDWYNINGDFQLLFDGLKVNCAVNDNDATFMDSVDPDKKGVTFKKHVDFIEVLRNNPFNIPIGKISKFQLLTQVKFNGDFQACMSYVQYFLIGVKIPYIRVGTDYIKIIKKVNHHNINQTILKNWKKEEIKQDHDKVMLNLIPKFDDFTIEPNNKNFSPAIGNNYNLYSAFSHKAKKETVSELDIPVTLLFLKHIFGDGKFTTATGEIVDKLELGLRYFKVLYEFPKQKLPILVLVSTENETGKTTFINFVDIIFGQNSVLIAPEELSENFNSSYATKNIIMIDESFTNKESDGNKTKSLSTAKKINVNSKFIASFSVPFFGKIIMCTNKEKNFMRIENENIRFWIRKIPNIVGKKNTNIENDLRDEIPAFLKYLEQMPDINFNNGSRMVFITDEIETEALRIAKSESKSSLHKELDIFIQDFFNDNEKLNSFEATATDIKNKWFTNNNQISTHYITKVIEDEMKIKKSDKTKRYMKFNEDSINAKNGFPFCFKRDSEYKEYTEEAIEELKPISIFKEELPF